MRVLNRIVTWLALVLIRGYQRWLSPYKGFHCAYRVYHGGAEGCSGYGMRVIRRYGVFAGYRLLQRRLWCCSVAAEQLREAQQTRLRMARAQAGFCDGIDPGCDGPDCDISDWLSGCAPDSCDWSSEEDPQPKKKKPNVPGSAEAGHCDLPAVDCDPSDLVTASCDALNCASPSAGCGSSKSPQYRPMKYKPLPKKI